VWNSLALLAANEVGGMFRRNVTALAFYAASGITALGGVAFGLVAAHLWLSTRMSGIEASLSIAGALLVLATVIAGIGYFMKNRRRTRTEVTSTALIALPIAARLVTSRVSWGMMTVAAVMAAGVLLGRQLGDKD
jgi:glucose uptake protein GlcU